MPLLSRPNPHLFRKRGLTALLVLIVSLGCTAVQPEQPPVTSEADPAGEQTPGQGESQKPDLSKVKFPGLKLDAENLRLDIDAKISIKEGLLEVVACTDDSREHESIVVVDAVPMHIHAALLLLGAENGNPAMMKPANEEKTEWVHIPPRGDKVAVSLVYKDAEGKEAERPISDFVRARTEEIDGLPPADPADEGGKKQKKPAEVFKAFLFAGSQLVVDEQGKRHYAADYSGNVVTISTFGDGLLCLPGIVTKDNSNLGWEIDPTHLPKVGTKVKLRFTVIEHKQNEDG